jgi:hypothetical protein
MRSRDFCAGPARTTRHFFSSLEFIKAYVVTAFDRSFTATDSTQLRRRRSFFGNVADTKVVLEGFHHQIGRFPPLFPGGLIDPPSYGCGNLDRVMYLAHC